MSLTTLKISADHLLKKMYSPWKHKLQSNLPLRPHVLNDNLLVTNTFKLLIDFPIYVKLHKARPPAKRDHELD